MGNIYDPVRQPVLYSAYSTSEESLEMFGMESLLYTLQQLDKMAEQLQCHFVANVCLRYDGDYVNARGDILFALTDAVRNAAIRIEQVPTDLREDVAAMITELGAA